MCQCYSIYSPAFIFQFMLAQAIPGEAFFPGYLI